MKRWLVLVMCLWGSAVFGQQSLYDGADAPTRAVLADIDRLVAARQYDTAYQKVAREEHNPYLVAKRVELALGYFAQSFNHKIFAFKDLTKGETLDSVRRGKGTFSMYPFDPEAVIQDLLSDGPDLPLLHKALADYYYEVGLRYQGRWTEDDVTVARKAVDHYQKALAGGLVTTTMLTNCADRSTLLEDYATASALYERALTLDPAQFNAAFNIAYSQLMLGNAAVALTWGDKAIARYAKNPQYQMDAFLLCADAAFAGQEFDRAFGYLDRALAISTEDYRVYQKLGIVSLGAGKVAQADENLDRLFAFAPTNPAATQMVSRAYLGAHNPEGLARFYQRNIKAYADLPEAQGNLYFHWGLQDEADGKPAEAFQKAEQAKAAFARAGVYDGEIRDAVETLMARNTPAKR